MEAARCSGLPVHLFAPGTIVLCSSAYPLTRVVLLHFSLAALDYAVLSEVPTPSATRGGLLILAGLTLFLFARSRAEKRTPRPY